MARGRRARVVGLLLALAAARATGAGVETSGYLELQLRGFLDEPAFPRQAEGVVPSLALQPEWRYRSQDRRQTFTFVPFLRWDAEDDERGHADIRELHWRYVGDEWEYLVGADKVFWGVAESRHLVDIINQTDLVEDIDEEDKLGQPMLQATTIRDWGIWSFFVMPGFRERTFPGPKGRLRAPLPVDTDAARYTSGADQQRIDIALRYAHTLGDWDLGVYYFHGNGREPRLIPNGDGTRLIPVYDLIHQVGADLQYTREAWLWKFEGIVREGQGSTFGALVAGFEYTLYQIRDSAADLGLLAEYHHDGRDANAPATIFDDDLFVGARLALNDTQDTELLTGVLLDRDTGEWFFNLEAERRLTPHLKGEIRARFFGGTEPGSLLDSISNDDYLQAALFYHF